MAERPSVADYVQTLKQTVPTMASQIKDLAIAEIKPAAKHGGIGAGLLGGAGAVGYIGLKVAGLACCFLFSMLYFNLLHLSHLAALAAGFATAALLMFIIALIVALIGVGQVKKVKAPEQTIAETKASIEAISSAISAGTAKAIATGEPVER